MRARAFPEGVPAAGATILRPPEDGHGMRFYSAEDLEGHRWVFGTSAGGSA